MKNINEVASFCKKKGFVFPSGEIYGGLSGFYDFGPLGVELKKNIKDYWWNHFVRYRSDIVGIDGSIITHPNTWVASGHVANFTDPLVDCLKCKARMRADHLIEDSTGMQVEGLSIKQINNIIREKNIKCPKCGGELSDARKYNLMFKTHIGPIDSDASIAYLRPETAQLIFTDFSIVQKTSRLKLPFGIAQIGKSFRNEISPRNFLFRLREFEQMEIEYFINEKDVNNCPFITDEVLNYKLLILSKGMQSSNKQAELMSIKNAIGRKIIKTKWHAYWIYESHKFLISLGVNPSKLRARQHLDEERSHYALDTWDIDYKYPFGWKELMGIANRTTFDLTQHMKLSGKDLTYLDPLTNKKITPYVVAEPSLGVERLFFTLLWDAYEVINDRVVLKLKPNIAPIKCAVLPLLKNNDEIVSTAKTIFNDLKGSFTCFYDENGSIGRRYRRMDEVGTPFCVTIDHDTLINESVTVRFRDSMKQERVLISELKNFILERLN